MSLQLTWVAQTPNTKTGNIPSAYVGATVDEAWESCEGCALRQRDCYAWSGLTYRSFVGITERRAERPERYSLEAALEGRKSTARAVRLGVMGDPARADRAELLEAVDRLRAEGLAILSYTHMWRSVEAKGLEGLCLASCENELGAQAALAQGWTPATILPWDHEGATFQVGDRKGLVCPAQTHESVTCNDCRLCDLSQPMWKKGKIAAIGFLDHSRAARRESRRANGGRQLPMFDRSAFDTRV